MFWDFLKRLEKVIIIIIYNLWFAISLRWGIVLNCLLFLLSFIYFNVYELNLVYFTLCAIRTRWFILSWSLLLILYYFVFLFLLFFLVFCFLRRTLKIIAIRENIWVLLLLWFLWSLSSLALRGRLYDDRLLYHYIFVWLFLRRLIICWCAIKFE